MVSLKKNFLYSIMYQILVIILPLISAPYISRVLGAAGIGEYSYTYSVATYFSLMAMLGISQHGNREIAECGDNLEVRSRRFWSIYLIQLCSHLMIIVFYILYLSFALKKTDILAWLQIIYIFSSLLDISWLFFGTEQFRLTVTRNVVIKVITLLLIFVIVKKQSDLWKYTLLLCISMLLSQMCLWLYLKKYIVAIKVGLKDIKKQIKPILVLFIPVIAYSIYKVMDKIMLGTMTNYEEVGLYDYAYKINNIPISLITAVGNVMLPRMTFLVANGKIKESNLYIKKTFYLVNYISSALVFGIAGISNNFAIVYYGDEFAKCGSLMVCLNWTVFFIVWANILRTQYLIPNRKDRIYVVSTLLGAVVNLLLNLFLIKKYYSMGAAIGTLCAEFTVMFVQLIAIRKDVPVIKYIISSTSYYVVGIVMMMFVRVIENSLGIGPFTLFVQVIGGASLFITLSAVVSYTKKDEIYRLLLMILSKIQSLLRRKS